MFLNVLQAGLNCIEMKMNYMSIVTSSVITCLPHLLKCQHLLTKEYALHAYVIMQENKFIYEGKFSDLDLISIPHLPKLYEIEVQTVFAFKISMSKIRVSLTIQWMQRKSTHISVHFLRCGIRLKRLLTWMGTNNCQMINIHDLHTIYNFRNRRKWFEKMIILIFSPLFSMIWISRWRLFSHKDERTDCFRFICEIGFHWTDSSKMNLIFSRFCCYKLMHKLREI